MGDRVWFHLAGSFVRIVSFLGYPRPVPSVAPSSTANPTSSPGSPRATVAPTIQFQPYWPDHSLDRPFASGDS